MGLGRIAGIKCGSAHFISINSRVIFIKSHFRVTFSLNDRDVGREMSEPGSSNQNKMTSNKVFFYQNLKMDEVQERKTRKEGRT